MQCRCVDSSVNIKILEMGYDAIGITMKLWEYSDVGEIIYKKIIVVISSINKAKLVCEKMESLTIQ